MSKRAFARHFAEMIVVMLLGMGVLEGLVAVVFAVPGSTSWRISRARSE